MRRCRLLLLLLTTAVTGCVHRIAFEDLRYPLDARREDMALVAVIDQATLDRTMSLLQSVAARGEAAR